MTLGGGGSYTGGRTMMGTKVILNIYDLVPANEYLYPLGIGVHHSGVEILGSEYSFASGAGIFQTPPKDASGARYRESIEIGSFYGGIAELNSVVNELQSEFGPHQYNILTKNCNHFSNSLVLSLLKKSIPSYVNRLAYIGGCVSCFLPSKMLEEAPVDDPGHSNSGYHVSASGSLGNSVAGTKARQAFSGLGHTMRASSPKVSESPRIDDLIDRRERARKAALVRLSR
jgi:hypothetical protein